MTQLDDAIKSGGRDALAHYGVKTAEGLAPSMAMHPFMPARPGAISGASSRAAVAKAFPRPTPMPAAAHAMQAAPRSGGLRLGGALGLAGAGALGAGVLGHMAGKTQEDNGEQLAYAPIQGGF